MSKRNSAATYLKVSKIRERQRKLELAKAQSEHQNACDQLEALDQKREEHVQDIREQVTDDAVSAASLSLMSNALLVSQQRVQEAAQQVDELAEPLEDARKELTASATRRRVAEKFVEKRVTTERMRKERKIQREADDMAATKSSRK